MGYDYKDIIIKVLNGIVFLMILYLSYLVIDLSNKRYDVISNEGENRIIVCDQKDNNINS